MGIFRATYSSFRSRRARRVLKKLGSRRSIFEQLECRELLAVDWRNPVDALDVNADGATVPIDALNVINDLNANGSRQLPAVKDPTKPFLDTDGDQFIAPLDVLQVVNGLNSGNVSPFRLNEGNSLARESTVTITLGQPAGTRTYRLQIDSTFDNTGTQSDVGDVLAVYLVNPNDHSETLLDRGTPGTALFTLTNGQAEFQLGTVRWDGSVLEIDLSQLPQLETGVLKLQLLSADNDFGTNITVQPLTNEVDPQGTPGNVFPSTPPLVPDGPLNVSQLAPLTSVEANFQNVRFDTTTGRLAAEVQLRNNGAAVSRNVAVAFPGLPTGVSLLNSAGTTATGAPFVNWQSALSGGGLPTGASSERMLVELDNPDNIQFPLVTEVLGAANRPPVFDPITAVNVSPGGVVNVALNATDPDGDQVTFSLDGAQPLPTGKLNANGTLTFTPVPADIGSYQLNVIASDGASTVTQTTTVNVVADPVTTTRVSGVVLDIDQTPLAGMQVEIGAVQGLTQADGSFTLDLGTGPVVGDTLKIRGETFPGPLIYPFIAEKLPFILEHDVLAGVNNVIGRPIFLPPLDVANGDTINPAQDTTVDTAAIPGASVFVKAGTLMNQQGTPFNGVLSITEVPVDRTPAALPDVLAPDLVVTIQPGEMVFATPASLTLPNLAGHAPGTEMDLWSINPISGEFDNVGTGRVTADGELVETISGGIRNSSWHFFAFQFAFQLALLRNLLENLEGNSNNQATFDSCEDCPPLFGTAKVDTGSQVELHSGVLFEDHQLVGYQSLGQQQSFRLQYNSLHADPRPIIHFAIDNAFGNSIGPVVDVAIARMSFTRNGVTQEVPGFTPPPGAFGLFFPGEHFWRIPQGTNRIDVALQANLAASPTGRYDFDVSWGIHRFSGLSSRSGASQEFNRREVVINKRQSVFGAGWDMAGLQEIFENEDGSILLVDGDREVIYEAPPNAGDPFVSPAADFGVMEKLPDGTYRYTDKFQTVTQFNDERKVASVTDRNGNRTTFDYDQTNNITKITDPVGLSTTFSYSDGRVSSITDPAGRVTQLIYNNIGDLIEIRDPDATRRRFEYDTEHRMTAEVDQRGNREEEVYGFHGRIIQTKDKDGSVRQFAPSQIQGLLPASQTVNRSSPPLAPIVPQNIAVATHTEPNGNVIVTTMNQAGAEIAKSDSVGALPTTTRLPNGFVSRKTDARGHVTDFTYDDRGNMLTIRDELTPANQSGGGGLFPGQQFAGSSFGNAADAQVGDLNNDGFDDFVTANETGNTASVYLSDGRGGLGNGTNLALAGRATNVAMGDLDNDGDRDLVAGHLTQQNTETISVFFNDGTGTFGARVELGTEPSDLSGGIVVDDLDDDGNADIVTALRNRTATIFFGDGTGAFPTRINHSIPTTWMATGCWISSCSISISV
jgi:YD repeat-containing protein